MKLKFLGAASGIVTGSGYVLISDSGKTSMLIDLGMFQGIPEIEKLNYEPLDCDPSQLTLKFSQSQKLKHSLSQ